MDARQVIDMLGAGQNSEAKSALEELLSAKAFDALEAKKQDVASTLFNGRTEDQPEAEEQIEAEETQGE
jgi:hypothetical protein